MRCSFRRRGCSSICYLFVLLFCLCSGRVQFHGRDIILRPPHSENEKPRSIYMFFAPKPGFGSRIPAQLLSWRDELERVHGEVVLLLNSDADIFSALQRGLKTERVRESKTGLPLLDSMLRVIATYRDSEMVGFCNSDIFPGENLARTIQQLLLMNVRNAPIYVVDPDLNLHKINQEREGWLLVSARVDFTKVPSDGATHMDGGVDVWVWNNVGDGLNDIFGVGAVIPAFRLGRPWFDNWLTATAMQLGGRHVIDGTKYFRIYHKIHKRMGSLSDWNDMELLSKDTDWVSNQKNAKEKVCFSGRCTEYRLGIGTSCEAPAELSLIDNENSRGKLVPRVRNRIQPCPSCVHCYD